ncbi:MAG: endodeoxyribonuclease [Pseudomonadota bacterium]
MKSRFRSGLERGIADHLSELGESFEYETVHVPYILHGRSRFYIPDFILSDTGIVIEAKGRFDAEDRGKHLAVKARHPDLDIRFVFSDAQKAIRHRSPATYADWCSRAGIAFADKAIPDSWLEEPPNAPSMAALEALMACQAEAA